MKKILANITRLTATYSKFLLMIMVLSSGETIAKADDALTYLKCGTKYLRLSGTRIKTNYNIRTKKFLDTYKISKYGEIWINAESMRLYTYPLHINLNRDTGVMGYGANQYSCKVINYNELPKANDEGKKF